MRSVQCCPKIIFDAMGYTCLFSQFLTKLTSTPIYRPFHKTKEKDKRKPKEKNKESSP